MNKDTLRVINSLGLEPDRLVLMSFEQDKLIIPDKNTIDSLFDTSTKYTEIERIGTGILFNALDIMITKQDLALKVNGKFSSGETFSVSFSYFPKVWVGWIELGEKVHEKYGSVTLVMTKGLKRLEDYLYRCQEGRYNYTYRSRTEIKP